MKRIQRGVLGLVVVLVVAALVGSLLWRGEAETPPQLPDAAGAAAHDAPAEAMTARETVPVAEAESEIPEDEERVAVTVAPRASITLRVEGIDESPVAGARVQALDDSLAGVLVTDSDGVCVLPIEPGEGSMHLLIEAERFFHSAKHWTRLAELTITLDPVTRLHGVVLDKQTHAPIAGAEITFGHRCEACDPEVCTTDASGSYEIAGYPVSKDYRLGVRGDGYPHQVFPVVLEEWAPSVRHDMELERGVAVAGRVVDLTTKAPVPGVKVQRSGHGVTLATTDAAGRFHGYTFTDRDGGVALGLSVERYCPVAFSVSAEELAATEPLEILLARGVSFAGTVRDSQGRPIDGALVWARASPIRRDSAEPSLSDRLPAAYRVDWRSRDLRTKTSDDGGFELQGAAPWSLDWTVGATHSGYRNAKVGVAEVGEPGSRVDLAITLESLGATAVIRGRVTVNGAAAVGWVRFTGTTRTGSCRTDQDGRYRLEEAEAGSLELRVTLENYDMSLFGSRAGQALDVEQGAELELDFELTIETAPISGRVTFSDAAPAQEVRIIVGDRAGHRHRAKTDAGGRYSVDVPAASGPFLVFASSAGGTEKVEGVEAGASGIDFVLPRSGKLRLRLVDPETGDPPQFFELFGRQSGGERFARWGRGGAWDSDDGWHTFSALAGTHELLIDAARAGYCRVRRDRVVIRPGAETEITLEIPFGAVARFSLAEGQEPPPGGAMLLTAEEWEEIGSRAEIRGLPFPGFLSPTRYLNFDRDGAAKIKGLTPGRYRFKVFGADIAIDPEYVDVGPGRNQVVELTWSRN